MSLAHNLHSVKKRPHMVAIIGASGAGKTVYLGLLMDLLTRHVGLMRSTAARADVDLAATDNHDSTRHGLVPGKNRRQPRTMALGALSVQLPAASPAVGTGDTRPLGRSPRHGNRACEPLSRDPLSAKQVRRGDGRLPMPNGCKPATSRKTSSRSSCCRSSASFAMIAHGLAQRGPNAARWRSCSPSRIGVDGLD